eukprot:GFYU01009945.1.p1 GENE.GFYU01009945.1~~GFYU01009945.1.p1  ORF type:complete len:176 (-),score=36.07 GFYU01009945.1:154-681(-)
MGKGISKKKKCSVLCAGLANSGKTTIVKRLSQELSPNDDAPTVVPTVGFHLDTFKFSNTSFTIMDMSGQEKYRKLWQASAKDANAVIYVVDISEEKQWEASGNALQELLQEEGMKDKPLLVFLNKSDVKANFDEEKVHEALRVREVHASVHFRKSSGKTGEGVNDGMTWLASKLS